MGFLKNLALKVIALCVILLVCVIFYIAYLDTKKVFNNSYILNKLIVNKEYYLGCIKLENNSLIVQDLYNFFSYNNKNNKVFPLAFKNLPSYFAQSTDVEKNKYVFLSIILPAVINEHNTIIMERNRLQAISDKFEKAPLSKSDLDFIKEMAEKYNVEMSDDNFWTYIITLRKLFTNVDTIPISIVLGMAAKESNWGSKESFLEGNSIFSQWALKDQSDSKVESGDTSITKFNSIEDAIKAYYYAINSSTPYRNFRALREKYMQHGKTMNTTQIISSLSSYYKGRNEYVKDLLLMIKNNNLEQYNNFSINKNYESTCVYFE